VVLDEIGFVGTLVARGAFIERRAAHFNNA
jgi:hypothetical protein